MRYVYVDESKRSGYVLVAVAVAGPAAARKTVRGLMLARQSRLHMVRESAARKALIVAAVVELGVVASVYDAGRRHPSELAARQACLNALADDLAAEDSRLTIEQDDGLVSSDQALLYRHAHDRARIGSLHYSHQRPAAEPLLALPDVIAWCWARGGGWREQVTGCTRLRLV